MIMPIDQLASDPNNANETLISTNPLKPKSNPRAKKLKKLIKALNSEIEIAIATIAKAIIARGLRRRLCGSLHIKSMVLEEGKCLLGFSALLHGCGCTSSTAIKEVHVNNAGSLPIEDPEDDGDGDGDHHHHRDKLHASSQLGSQNSISKRDYINAFLINQIEFKRHHHRKLSVSDTKSSYHGSSHAKQSSYDNYDTNSSKHGGSHHYHHHHKQQHHHYHRHHRHNRSLQDHHLHYHHRRSQSEYDYPHMPHRQSLTGSENDSSHSSQTICVHCKELYHRRQLLLKAKMILAADNSLIFSDDPPTFELPSQQSSKESMDDHYRKKKLHRERLSRYRRAMEMSDEFHSRKKISAHGSNNELIKGAEFHVTKDPFRYHHPRRGITLRDALRYASIEDAYYSAIQQAALKNHGNHVNQGEENSSSESILRPRNSNETNQCMELESDNQQHHQQYRHRRYHHHHHQQPHLKVHSGIWMRNTIPVVKYSQNPYEDFHESMIEMLLGRGLRSLHELQDMFVCLYLLNSPSNRLHVKMAFKDLLTDLYKCKISKTINRHVR